MLISELPLISGAKAGKPLRCTHEVYPVYQELLKAGFHGSHWARMLIKELSTVSSGRLSKYRGQYKPLGKGISRYILSLAGVQFLIDRYSNDQYVLSGVHFALGNTVAAVRKALKASPSAYVAAPIATTLSAKGESFLKSIEVLRLKPYDDQTGDALDAWVEGATIGYGHLIPKPEWALFKNGVSEPQADTLFKSDLLPFVTAVNRYVDTPLNSHQFDALVILAFNIGVSALSKSSAVAMINNPDAVTPYTNIESAWKAWRKSQGKVNQGLVNRRAAEWKIYTQGVYQQW